MGDEFAIIFKETNFWDTEIVCVRDCAPSYLCMDPGPFLYPSSFHLSLLSLSSLLSPLYLSLSPSLPFPVSQAHILPPPPRPVSFSLSLDKWTVN